MRKSIAKETLVVNKGGSNHIQERLPVSLIIMEATYLNPDYNLSVSLMTIITFRKLPV